MTIVCKTGAGGLSSTYTDTHIYLSAHTVQFIFSERIDIQDVSFAYK